MIVSHFDPCGFVCKVGDVELDSTSRPGCGIVPRAPVSGVRPGAATRVVMIDLPSYLIRLLLCSLLLPVCKVFETEEPCNNHYICCCSIFWSSVTPPITFETCAPTVSPRDSAHASPVVFTDALLGCPIL